MADRTAAETRKLRSELAKFANKTDLGLLEKEQRDSLIDLAIEKDEPQAFLAEQAAAVETSVNAGQDPPELPADLQEVQAGLDVQCPASSRHKNIRRYAKAAGNRRSYVCDDCGTTWTK